MLNERCTAWPFSGCFTSQCQCQLSNVFPKRGAFIFSCMLLKTLVPQTTFKARTGLANPTMHCPTFLRVNSSMSMSTPASQLDQSSEKKVQRDRLRIICCGRSSWKMLKSPRIVNFEEEEDNVWIHHHFCVCLMFYCRVTMYACKHWIRHYGSWVSSKARVMVILCFCTGDGETLRKEKQNIRSNYHLLFSLCCIFSWNIIELPAVVLFDESEVHN